MKRLRLICFLFAFTFINDAFSQSGCLISSNNTVYTQTEPVLINDVLRLLLGGNPSYTSTSGIGLAPNFCSWSPISSGPVNCGVCLEYNISVVVLVPVVTGCKAGKLLNGHIGNYTMVQCNLDDYNLSWVAVSGILGLLIIRQRNKH